MAEIPFPDEFRIGDVCAMTVFDLDDENIEYGYRMDGPFDPDVGPSLRLDQDPARPLRAGHRRARRLGRASRTGTTSTSTAARLVFDDFDWEGDRPLEIADRRPGHLRDARARLHPRIRRRACQHPGTFAGMREKIPYLKELGVNCVELLPIFEFDEFENSRIQPDDRRDCCCNYWGYSTVGFFAPKAGYAATGQVRHAGRRAEDPGQGAARERHRGHPRRRVQPHRRGQRARARTISFRGIDNQTYYMLTPEGYYYNFSGTGNTLNCNNPVVRNMVLDCLRYWAAEYHIDGFRFDLAAILGRDPDGAPLANPPLLESLAFDPILAKCKLIAEAWDAGGLYQVGCFPAYGRWAEWNGKYRDTVRRFLKGDDGHGRRDGQRV